MPRRSINSRRTWVLPGLEIEPCTREVPEERSEGDSPTQAPVEDPLNRVQSPISTVRDSARRYWRRGGFARLEETAQL